MVMEEGGAPYGRHTIQHFQRLRRKVGLNAALCFSAFLAASVQPFPAAQASVEQMVQASAEKHGVPPGLALRISKVESKHSCGKVGSSGERGPLQVLPSTARHLGYRNIARASCASQIDAGMAYLGYCYRGARGDHRRAAACYNAGPRALKWKRYPARVQQYVRKVAG